MTASRLLLCLALTIGGPALAACAPQERDEGPWLATAAPVVLSAEPFLDPTLTESSGVAVSRTYPGILWTHNDAGHSARLFATDTAGAILGWWTVPDASSYDWEDIALGPCPQGSCLYIGDVGDNGERRREVTVYRVPEPDATTLGGGTAPAEALVIRYPDKPRDVEALFVDDSSTVWLVSKGRSDGIFLYRIPAIAWETGRATAERVDSLPIANHFVSGNVVTGATIAPDQRRVVVRTYRDLYFFERQPDGRLAPRAGPNRCDILGMEIQGEAVDWWDDSTLVLTSERGAGSPGVVRLVRCGG